MQFELSQAIQMLARTPFTMHAMLAGVPQEWSTANEGPDTFSAFDNLGHLIHGERADWIPRVRVILAQGADRRFAPYDRFAQVRESAGKSLAQLLIEFSDLRARNVDVLTRMQLTERELALEGEHPQFGAVTLRQLLATWVVHDLGHVAQVARVMARQYHEEVGPWTAYLPILTRR